MRKIGGYIFSFLLGAVIFGTIGVYGAAKYLASDIQFSSEKTKATNVSEALEELYEKADDIYYSSLINKTWTFDYTGVEEEFEAPMNGTYKIEVWGASGGTTSSLNYGYGGYSVGNIDLSENDILYVNVGGMGNNSCSSSCSGGYNGGGDNTGYNGYGYGGSGGGATSLALKSGVLSELSSDVDKILIVAGGGAGTGKETSSTGYVIGGSGGGIEGTVGTAQRSTCGSASTQTSGYSFGKGASATSWSSAGGGGFYGGNLCSGGSGYIGNENLKDKEMYCYNCNESSVEDTKTSSTTCSSETAVKNCSKMGNGFVKITLVALK